MYFNAAQWVFSPSDLTTFVDSEYASWMEHYRCAYPERAPEPDAADSMMGLLQDKGEVHEQAVLAAFMAEGLQVADISTALDKAQATTEAMAQGVEVIFQACLEKAPFKGYADFLVKVPGPSVLGDYHYEVWDSKLSNTVKPYFVMQLCCYAEMLEALQGCRAEFMVVALGDGVRERLRCEDYFYYYHSVKSAFLQWHAAFNPEQPPHPGAYARWGRWAEVAQAQLVAEDHLSQVATLTRVQIKHLEAAGIATMQQLAEAALPPVSGLTAAQLQRLQRQALLQKQSQAQPLPAYEVVAHAPGVKQGLA
ncbi:MAG: helicase, partial [Gammaproteobacteria bacterium]|nr:helicase [Gammaproteobacteria bacterium]